MSTRLSFSTTVTFDHVIVEAAPSGTDQWTTLRDLRGGTSPAPPSPCPIDLLTTHPFLSHYLTAGTPCTPRGTTGTWNAFTNESGGWREAAFDLSAYVGGSVDVKISYVANADVGAKNGVGVFVDDTRVTTTAGTLDADGFEGETSLWTPEGPPAGSPPANGRGFAITSEAIAVARRSRPGTPCCSATASRPWRHRRSGPRSSGGRSITCWSSRCPDVGRPTGGPSPGRAPRLQPLSAAAVGVVARRRLGGSSAQGRSSRRDVPSPQ